jgi:NitT/TauT family transport system permease protein
MPCFSQKYSFFRLKLRFRTKSTPNMNKYLQIFKPYGKTDKSTIGIMVLFQIIVVALVWLFSSSPLLPKPTEIFSSLGKLISEDNLIQELWTSMSLSIQSMLIAIVISLLISYATVIPFFRPLAFMVSKFRFLTLVGLSFVFTMITHSGHSLKVSLMVFGITVFFVTNMVAEIENVTKNELNHARTLRMPEWQVVWEVIILGKMDKVFEIIRQNFAISWMMLTMIEGISRTEGGIGTMLLNQNKHFHLEAVFAIQIVILIVGIIMDYGIGALKNLFCPHAALTLEKR